MKVLHSMRQLLSRPYPAPESFIDDIKGVGLAAVIVTAILYVFRPFGMSFYEGNVLGVSALFGAVSLIAGGLYTIILRSAIKSMSYQAQYNLGKWIVEIIGLLLFISFGNWLVMVYINQGDYSLSSFVVSLFVTCLIGIIPIVIFGLQNQIKQERRNAATALNMVTQLHNNEQQSDIPQAMILAIQAMENYINVYTLKGDTVHKEAIRRTLKSAQADDMYQSLVKCHRSYLINPASITEVEGNAQGLRLNLGHKDCPIIPVSRSYIPTIKALLS